MLAHFRLGGDVLEYEIENTPCGKAHDSGSQHWLVLQPQVTTASCHWPQKADREEAPKSGAGRGPRGSDFAKRVEALGQILCTDEQGEE